MELEELKRQKKIYDESSNLIGQLIEIYEKIKITVDSEELEKLEEKSKEILGKYLVTIMMLK